MKATVGAVMVLCIGSWALLTAQIGPKLEARTMIAAAIPGVVAAGEKVELIHDGLKGSDNAIAMPDGRVIFVEQNTTHILQIHPDNSLSTLVDDVPGTRSLGVDARGRVTALMWSTPQRKTDYVKVIYPPDRVAMIAETVEGRSFGTANDFVTSSQGAIYMTDAGSLVDARGNFSLKPAGSQETWLYYIPPGGKPRKVADKADRIAMPNGIGLSPDEKTLYVNDSRGDYVVAFDIQPDGTLKNRRDFAKYEILPEHRDMFPYQSDGLAVDAAGRVYVAMPLSVEVFSPGGQFLGKIPVSKKVQNLAFGGADRKTLYIVANGSVWKVRMIAQGVTNRAK